MSERTAVVIDDETDITEYLTTLLEDHGWRVRAANSAAEGVDLIGATHPDVVILDVLMPERGGLSTLVAIRKNPATAATPVVLLSGIQDQLTGDFRGFLDRVKAHRPNAFLDKPVDPEVLLGTLDRVLQA